MENSFFLWKKEKKEEENKEKFSNSHLSLIIIFLNKIKIIINIQQSLSYLSVSFCLERKC